MSPYLNGKWELLLGGNFFIEWWESEESFFSLLKYLTKRHKEDSNR